MGFVTRTDLRLVWPDSGQSALCQPIISQSRQARAKVLRHITRPGKVTIAVPAAMRQREHHDQNNNAHHLAFRGADCGLAIDDNGCAGCQLLFCGLTRYVQAGRLGNLLPGGFFNLQQYHRIIGERTGFQPDHAGRHGNVVCPEKQCQFADPGDQPVMDWPGDRQHRDAGCCPRPGRLRQRQSEWPLLRQRHGYENIPLPAPVNVDGQDRIGPHQALTMVIGKTQKQLQANDRVAANPTRGRAAGIFVTALVLAEAIARRGRYKSTYEVDFWHHRHIAAPVPRRRLCPKLIRRRSYP